MLVNECMHRHSRLQRRAARSTPWPSDLCCPVKAPAHVGAALVGGDHAAAAAHAAAVFGAL